MGGAVLRWNIQRSLKGAHLSFAFFLEVLNYLIARITPILGYLRTLHNFTIESQVQFHARLAFTPLQLEELYAVSREDLSVFVNSAEWTLCSSCSFLSNTDSEMIFSVEFIQRPCFAFYTVYTIFTTSATSYLGEG